MVQSRHLPSSLAFCRCSCASCRWYSLRSGVLFLAWSYSRRVSLAVSGSLALVAGGLFPSPLGFGLGSFFLARVVCLVPARGLRGSGKVCWNVILLEPCAWAGQPLTWDRLLRRTQSGLSPRGRGNLARLVRRRSRKVSRSIPAWAGQPVRMKAQGMGRVIPAWAGQPEGADLRSIPAWAGQPPQYVMARSIPAWAGQPAQGHCVPCEVYPRVGGATCCNRALPDEGQLGSIPAWAGQPPGFSIVRLHISVYPRVGGATHAPRQVPATKYRVYPRVGGATGVPAGLNSPVGGDRHSHGKVYPRVGGATRTTFLLSSPVPAIAVYPRVGGATQAATLLRSERQLTVYPRVGGATLPGSRFRNSDYGLSPRGRGNPFQAGAVMMVTPGSGLSPRGRGNLLLSG